MPGTSRIFHFSSSCLRLREAFPAGFNPDPTVYAAAYAAVHRRRARAPLFRQIA
jgi:hypothetical protein